MVDQIINDYLNENFSIEKLAKKYNLGKLKLKKILLDNNIQLKTKGGQIKHTLVDFNVDIKNKDLCCNNCQKIFSDVENKSGAITQHMKKCFPNISIPNKLFRSNYKKNNGTYWHFQYFTLKDKLQKETFVCPECGWETYDVNNNTGAITKHIESKHISVSEFIVKHPNLQFIFNKFNKNVQLNEYLSNNNNNVTCLICDGKFKTITNTHIETHGITLDDYKVKFNNPPLVSKDLTEKYVTNLINISSDNITYRSKAEIEICKFLEENDIKYSVCDKKILNGVELDIFIPKYNLAIEYNGLYWHSEKQGKGKYYHIDKTNKCLEKDIRLIHIFSDEWLNKSDIIKSRLKHLLNLELEKIYARKCSVGYITKEEKTEFLNDNHLQGNDKSDIFIGLKYNGILVSVITFGSLRKSLGATKKENQYELYRFATKNVVGGFSKLFSFFIKNHNPDSIITYADRNWTPSDNYSFYNKVGFNYEDITKPNYYYTNNYQKRLHRYNFTKDKLIKYGHDKTKTETEIMLELGYDRIWDTGNLKYIYNKKRKD